MLSMWAAPQRASSLEQLLLLVEPWHGLVNPESFGGISRLLVLSAFLTRPGTEQLYDEAASDSWQK